MYKSNWISKQEDLRKRFKEVSVDFRNLCDENESLKARLETFCKQAKAIDENHEKYLQARGDGHMDSIKKHGIIQSQLIAGLLFLALKEDKYDEQGQA